MTEGNLDSNEPGTCARFNGGKVMFSLLPMHLLAGTCRVLMYGAQKYAAWNWAKGGKWSQSFDCACRHLFKWYFCGEDVDPESGQHHLDHVMCNILFLRHNTLMFQEGDDRPPAHAMMGGEINFVNEPFEAPEPVIDDAPFSATYEPDVVQCIGCGIPLLAPYVSANYHDRCHNCAAVYDADPQPFGIDYWIQKDTTIPEAAGETS
jgi:hypothetical protein